MLVYHSLSTPSIFVSFRRPPAIYLILYISICISCHSSMRVSRFFRFLVYPSSLSERRGGRRRTFPPNPSLFFLNMTSTFCSYLPTPSICPCFYLCLFSSADLAPSIYLLSLAIFLFVSIYNCINIFIFFCFLYL